MFNYQNSGFEVKTVYKQPVVIVDHQVVSLNPDEEEEQWSIHFPDFNDSFFQSLSNIDGSKWDRNQRIMFVPAAAITKNELENLITGEGYAKKFN